MLVLTRKQQQEITIGDNITITILRLKGNTVRVGIDAPEGVRILRAELTGKEFEQPTAMEASEMPAEQASADFAPADSGKLPPLHLPSLRRKGPKNDRQPQRSNSPAQPSDMEMPANLLGDLEPVCLSLVSFG